MPEFDPVNELIKKEYEEALLCGLHRDEKTVRAVWESINRFEKFTNHENFKTFSKDQARGFREWLEKQTNPKGDLLSLSTTRSTLANLRTFFEWLAIHPKFGKKKIDGGAILYLKLSDNANRAARASRAKTPPTMQQLEQALRAMPSKTDIEMRDRAMFAFVIITCIRDDALVSLKMIDVDAEKRNVWQNPRHVRTKGRKNIVTGFVRAVMPIAEDIVLEWFEHATTVLQLKPNDPLFPKTLVTQNPKTLSFEVQGLSNEHWAGSQSMRNICKKAFEAVDAPYFNPHLFRNAVCKWALKKCTPYEFKALSQNFGHEHAMITYNSYGTLTEDEQLEAISNIGQTNPDLQNVSMDDILAEVGRRTGK